MELKEFVKNAVRTESRIDEVKVNWDLLINTVESLILLGDVLDQIKKYVFYGKPYNVDKLEEAQQMTIYHMKELWRVVDTPDENETAIPVNPRIFHAIVGISTEATELLDALDLDLGTLDSINIQEELGDLDWYKAIAVDELGADWDLILTRIIDKLRARYGEKFNTEGAIYRDLDKEREILNTLE